jgi:hypothetical protein
MNSLQAMHPLGRDPLRMNQRVERAESLSVENIHTAFQKDFPSDRYAVVTPMPEQPRARHRRNRRVPCVVIRFPRFVA